jgi:hypothetical protein
MISEKEYLEAQMVIKLYESQQLNTSSIISKSDLKRPAPPPPPMDRRWREGEEPPKPINSKYYQKIKITK